MFDSPELKAHIESSQTIKSKAFVVAEWNLNDPENIKRIGNYRNRWNDDTSAYYNLVSIFYENDQGGWWTNATNCDVEVEGPFDENDEPTLFISEDLRFKYLYSLDDCFKPHRPRSGINYPLYFDGKYFDGTSSVNRPRYYLGHKENEFKYWTSYRKVSGGNEEFTGEVGISKRDTVDTSRYYIYDAAPFVVYKNTIPTNKIVVKMQTNIGTEEKTNIVDFSGNTITDPLYGNQNATTPKNWSIQVLKGNIWTTIKEFGENETRPNGSPIVGPDGYVELVYGIIIPPELITTVSSTRFLGTVANPSLLPDRAYPGDYMYVVSSENTNGLAYFWTQEGTWQSFLPQYGWQLNNNYDYVGQYLLTDFTNPSSFNELGKTTYREFEYIDGIRIVVKTMNKIDSTFDLIELSPRLQADMTDRVVSFRANKTVGNVDQTALPVGNLQAGTGTIEIFDFDNSFRENNSTSIISGFLQQNISFDFYDLIEDEEKNYYVPIKKLHTESKAPSYSDVATVNYELRDSFYIFENSEAPQIMLTQVSLSYAVATLLDLIGFSNYVFYRDTNYPEPTIPYFFVAPDQNVAEVLNKLSFATQSAMFFDEYNNFVVMYKEYLMGSRTPSLILDGNSNIPNIADIASSEKKVYNDGIINYTERYLQRSIGSLSQANSLNRDQNWIYLPSLLWEVSGTDALRTVNDKVATQSSYALTAMPLNTSLIAAHPTVENRKIINNTINVGDNVYWLTRYNGYLYANGEIIKFDAVEHSVQGQSNNVWISSNDEYQKYFSELPFNGKMYPTGLIRIYSEPYYEEINGVEYLKNGSVAKSGRAQFGTQLTEHNAGLSTTWSSSDNLRGLKMNSEIMFTAETPPATTTGPAGVNNSQVQSAGRNSIIKNFMRDVTDTDSSNINLPLSDRGMIQASAFVFNGPSFPAGELPRDWISYVYKPLDTDFKNFGTRMRIIGKLEAASDVEQNPVGSMNFYSAILDNESLILNGGAGGIGIGVNPETNNGYFLELIALTNTNLSEISGSEDYESETVTHNIVFYKVVRNQSATSNSDSAIPIKLWGGLADIIVDSGTFVGQQRMTGEENTTVYDVSVEWKDIGSIRRFYVFINGRQVATIDDNAPIPLYSNMCLFVRGSSKVMFENVYALRQNASENTEGNILAANTVSDAFGLNIIDQKNDSLVGGTLDIAGFRKYGISGFVQQSYLSGISSSSQPSFNMYYEEFGTIMREAAYFDVKYDKAYPALIAQISPVLNEVPGFTVSGFEAGPYSAKFLVFNTMDKAITLDETSGNYLRIQGVTFTQNTTHEYKMDDYFNEISNLADPQITPDNIVINSPRTAEDKYKEIKIKRAKYGKSEWTIDSDYIQTQNTAFNLMTWLTDKTTRPRQLIGVEIFNNPMIQLGDVVTINYTKDGINTYTPTDRKFVVYNIEYSRSGSGPTTNIYLSEV